MAIRGLTNAKAAYPEYCAQILTLFGVDYFYLPTSLVVCESLFRTKRIDILTPNLV